MKIKTILPGVCLALILAAVAKMIAAVLPIHLIGAPVIALFLGMAINHFYKPSASVQTGLTFMSKRVLKFAIILLGASLHLGHVFRVGAMSLVVMIFTLITCFLGGYYIGKALGLNWKLSNLISAGTGICGGSAIAAIAPVIEADDSDIAYAMSATFLFDIAMIMLFPILGHMLGLSDIAYGLWTGTAVNDTSSVVAAGYAYSQHAGDFAVMVKLTRTLSIIPTVIIFSLIQSNLKRKENAGLQTKKVNLLQLFPWFILGFLALTGINSLGLISDATGHFLKDTSKFLMISALAAIGLKTDFSKMRKSGLQPMVHGFIISALVVIVAIIVEYGMGII
ncbi:YeiH family putative sulfate export transporter [Carnobacteriaceae bacterium zg-ZUI252]|nr:YeiH family putative sulfate export transporter [Carnobacteriaceae bacterium zg-ZUI252]QTU82507.1 YeiH family putative sulfate export transporter [Carnobacteriaceae bacterium zg-C25]